MFLTYSRHTCVSSWVKDARPDSTSVIPISYKAVQCYLKLLQYSSIFTRFSRHYRPMASAQSA